MEGVPQQEQYDEQELDHEEEVATSAATTAPGDSAIKRALGVPKDSNWSEGAVLSILADEFEDQLWDKSEIPKTKEQLEVIEDVIALLPEFLRQYGLENPINFSPRHVHILDIDKTDLPKSKKRELKKEYEKYPAEWSWSNQSIMIENGYAKKASPLEFAHVVAHELIHGLGFSSITVEELDEAHNDFDYRQRRSGLVFISKSESENKSDATHIKNKDVLFDGINEAVVEELALRFIRSNLQQIKHTKKDIPYIQKILKKEKRYLEKKMGESLIVADELSGEQTEGEGKVHILSWPSYNKQRQEFDALLNDLYQKNHDRFESREEIFNLFTRAHFTGRVLELARLINSSYDDLDFRALGEKTKIQRKDIEHND